MSAEADTRSLLQALEQQLLDPLTRKDPEAMAALLDDEFREFGSSGRLFTKAEIILLLAAEPSRRIGIDDFACQLIAANVALVTYRSTSSGFTTGAVALRSSVWVLRDARWQMLFHQGTKLAPPESQKEADAVS